MPDENKALVWDKTGDRWYETGTDRGILYPMTSGGGYGEGVAWNGLTAVNEAPEGAEATDLWADNIKYASLRSAETFKYTIEAYTYPEEFMECDGSVEIVKGAYIGQQPRKGFGFCYRSKLGNDTATESDDGYKLHLIYNSTASPSEKDYATINDSPDAITFSWECETTPVNVTGHKPTSEVTIDSRYADAAKLTALEAILYGSGSTAPRLPLPDEVVTLLTTP